MVCHKQALCSSTGSVLASVLAQGSEAVAAGTMEEGVLCSLNVLLLPLPCLQHARLEGTAVGEREGPGLRGFVGINGIEMDSSDDLGLTSGEEGDARNGHGQVALKRGDGCSCDVLRGVLLGTGYSG